MKTLYKFLRTGLKSDNGEKRDWEIGVWRKEDDIKICDRGFHASLTPLQALRYVNGEILAEVSVRGDSQIEDSKECWSEMKITKAYHWKKENSVALAIYAAELVLDIFEKEYPNDKRPREAIEAAKNWIKNPSKSTASSASSAADAAFAAANSAFAANSTAAYSAAAFAADAANSAAYAAAYAASANTYAAADAKKEIIDNLDKWFMKEIKKLEPYE